MQMASKYNMQRAATRLTSVMSRRLTASGPQWAGMVTGKERVRERTQAVTTEFSHGSETSPRQRGEQDCFPSRPQLDQ